MDWSKTCSLLDLLQVDLTTFLASRARGRAHIKVINVKPACQGGGGGRAWGGDLIAFVGPGVGHLTDIVLPGEGIFESFFARRGRDI